MEADSTEGDIPAGGAMGAGIREGGPQGDVPPEDAHRVVSHVRGGCRGVHLRGGCWDAHLAGGLLHLAERFEVC